MIDPLPEGYESPPLGVATFNQRQRSYVEGLLRDTGGDRLIDALEDSDGLFIKNLENVRATSATSSFLDRLQCERARPAPIGPVGRAGSTSQSLVLGTK